MNPFIRTVCLIALLLSPTTALALPVVVTDLGLLPGDAAIASAVGSQQDHAACKGGSQVLVAWSDDRGQSVGGGAAQSGGDIFGIRLDAQGNPLDAAPFLIAGGMGLQRMPHIAWNGSAWLVVYLSQDPVGLYYEERMRAVRVSAAGAVLDATPIEFPATQFAPNTIGLNVTGQNNQWLVTRCIYHADGYGTYLAGQRIDASGTLLDTTPLMLLDWIYGGTVALASGGEYLVGGPDWNGVATAKGQRVGQNGVPIGAALTLPSLNIASNGSEYYLTWIKNSVSMVGSRMTTAGTLLTPAGTTILANITQFSGSTLTHDGTQWWFEWGVSDQLHTVRINAAGTVLDANGGPLLPITIGGNVNNAYSPTLVGRTGGGVLLFWYDMRVALNYDTNVFALPISASNAAGTERCVSTATRNQRSPDLCAGPDGKAAIVFVSEAANDRRVLVHLLDAGGHPTTAAPIEVASAPGIGRAAIAWNGSIFMITWDGGVTGDPLLQVEARRMNPNGTFVDAAPFDVLTGYAPDIEALGDDFLIACSRAMNFQTITAWMRVVDGPTAAYVTPATILGGGYVSTGPNVRQDGARWVVTYESHWTHDSSQSDAIYNFVSPAGVVTSPLNPATTSGGSGTPDVAFSGSKYLFVWRNNSLANANNYIAGRIMNADGSFATGNFTIAEAQGRQLRPSAGWDGTSFVVVWDDQRNQGSFFDERTDVYGARVSESGSVLDPDAFVIESGPQGDATAALLARSGAPSLVTSARFETVPPFDSYRVGLSAISPGSTLDVPIEATGRLALQQNTPNPFGTTTNIAYRLAQAENVSLAIFDTQGRAVRTLVHGQEQPAGEHTSEWNGRDDAGARVPPGLYLIRLHTPAHSETRRMVMTGR